MNRPIPMVLHCPSCHRQHIDKSDPSVGWTNPPHKSHKCICGCIWRPADVETTGVPMVSTRGKADTWPVDNDKFLKDMRDTHGAGWWF